MSLRKLVQNLLVLLSILAGVSLIAGSILGQPILLSYVETGSMSPTLEPGDGFIAVPTQIEGSIEQGEIIVFEAKKIQGGGLTTHRVVDRTDRGYITKGDGNPFTDQSNNEPPVKRAQIVAKVLEVNGQVLVIPHLGTIVEVTQSSTETIQRQLASILGSRSLLGVRGLGYLLFVISLLWYFIGEWRDRNTKRRDRKTSRIDGINSQLIIGAFSALLILSATAAMIGPSGTQEYGIVSAEFESDRPTVIPNGESQDVAYPIDNTGFIPTVTYLEPASDGVDINQREVYTGGQKVINATITLHAPTQTGYYRRFVVEHRYLVLLPLPVIRNLYLLHPWAPVLAIDALIGIPFYFIGIAFVGKRRFRARSCDRPTRIDRLVNRWT